MDVEVRSARRGDEPSRAAIPSVKQNHHDGRVAEGMFGRPRRDLEEHCVLASDHREPCGQALVVKGHAAQSPPLINSLDRLARWRQPVGAIGLSDCLPAPPPEARREPAHRGGDAPSCGPTERKSIRGLGTNIPERRLLVCPLGLVCRELSCYLVMSAFKPLAGALDAIRWIHGNGWTSDAT